jgi:transposase
MSRMTVLTGPERRRRWSGDERLRILTEAFSPGACVSEVARRHDVSTALIYGWRRKLRRELPAPASSALLAMSPSTMVGTSFAEAVLTDEPEPDVAETGAAIVIDLPGGGRVSIAASTPPALAAAALKALR